MEEKKVEIKQTENLDTAKKELDKITLVTDVKQETEVKEKNETKKQEEIKCSQGCKLSCLGCLEALAIIFLTFVTVVSVIAISIIADLIYVIGISVAKKKNKECASDIYPKIKLLVILNSISIGLSFLYQVFACDKDYTSNDGKCFRLIIRSVLSFACFVLIMVSLMFGQIFYNKTKNWENCGSIKGWIIYGQIINYAVISCAFIKFIISIVKFIKKEIKEY